jgi:hypothetical protein
MRIFLAFLVFDMLFQSFVALTPADDWCKELGMRKFPDSLPTAEKRRQLAEKTSDDNPDPIGDRVWEAVDSVWDFFKPWPSQQTRRKIADWGDRRRFAVCWLTTRLGFLNRLVRFEQGWEMFSPNVVKGERFIRVQLRFADGSEENFPLTSFPEDLTRYDGLRFFDKKRRQVQIKLSQDREARLGYYALIAHRQPHNDRGSPLTRIYLYKVWVHYPAPGEDAEAVLREQNGAWDRDDQQPCFEYDVNTRKGYQLDD